MTPQDDPVDLRAVAADDAALDALRTTEVDDPALALLRALLLDVERDLPEDVPAAPGPTPAAPATADHRRLARGGAVVAAVSAGLLTLGGVAAASTPGSPLHGLGEAVRSAAGAVVGAVTPQEPPERAAVAVASPSSSPSTRPTPAATAAPRTPAPGPTVAALARSEAAARQVDQLLDAAEELLRDGRASAAAARLDLAERRLAEVLPVHVADLRERLAALRAQASPAPRPSRQAERSPRPEPARTTPPKRDGAKPAVTRGSSRSAPPSSQGKAADRGPDDPGQPSVRDASVKPRA